MNFVKYIVRAKSVAHTAALCILVALTSFTVQATSMPTDESEFHYIAPDNTLYVIESLIPTIDGTENIETLTFENGIAFTDLGEKVFSESENSTISLLLPEKRMHRLITLRNADPQRLLNPPRL